MLHIEFKYPAWQFLLLFPMALCACAGDEANTPTPSGNDTPVSFSASDKWNNDETRLVEDDKTTSFSAGDNIGVFAYKGTSQTPDFMNNQRVTYDGSAWSYSPIKYWPQNEGLSFYAYYPWRESTDKIIINDVSANRPVLTYTNTDSKIDLLTACAPGQSYLKNSGNVSLKMKHQLIRIQFRFRNTWQAGGDKYRLGINYLHVSYRANTVLSYNYVDSSATYGNDATIEYMAEVINAKDYYPYDANLFHNITTPYFIVPEFIKEGKIELGIDVFQKNEESEKWEKVTEHDTPTYIVATTLPEKDNLSKGSSIVYDISYQPSAGVTITLITKIDGWEEVDNDNII